MMRCVRRITHSPRVPREGYEVLSDERLRAKFNVESVQSRLRRRRIAHAVALLRTPWPELDALIYAAPHDTSGLAPSWPDAVLQDLREVREEAPELHYLPDPAVGWEAWREFIVNDTANTLKKAVRGAKKTSSSLIGEKLKVVVNRDAEDVPCGAYICTECPPGAARVFADNKALSSHRMRCHQHRKLARRYINSDVCPACNKKFPSVARALDHLEYRSKSCHTKMVAGDLPLLF